MSLLQSFLNLVPPLKHFIKTAFKVRLSLAKVQSTAVFNSDSSAFVQSRVLPMVCDGQCAKGQEQLGRNCLRTAGLVFLSGCKAGSEGGCWGEEAGRPSRPGDSSGASSSYCHENTFVADFKPFLDPPFPC